MQVRLRRFVVPAVLALLLPATAHAQRAGDRLIGVTGGATLSDIGGNGWNSTEDRWGGTAGVFAAMRTSRNTVVQAEANWTQMGGGDLRLDYIQIPLTFGGAAPLGDGGLRGRFYTGIGIDIKVGCSDSTTGLTDYCDLANDVAWSWPLGLQIVQQLQSGAFIGVDARYTFGISDALEDINAYNRLWQFRLIVGKKAG